MHDIDAWRVAGQLIKSYGDEARLIAAQRADALLDNGDMEGFYAWKRIANALASLEKREVSRNETSH
ncbi:MAG TPA: hypothetical protein VN682_07195 [Terriglobales bacterium]|nr:hypothetical protein [Terriglobales bacterium]